MITSKDVIGPERDPTITHHVYAHLVAKNGDTVAICLLHPEDKRSYAVNGKNFERQKERDEHGRIIFRESKGESK